MANPARMIMQDEDDPKVFELAGEYESDLKKGFYICIALLSLMVGILETY
ncbi:hypothetical protein [Agarilytica rhodophyticola]|nr:hypothetical protein [Agarilytica rhodophyticola]